MTGKFLIAGTFALAYLYTAELFPTPVRFMMARLIPPPPIRVIQGLRFKKKEWRVKNFAQKKEKQ